MRIKTVFLIFILISLISLLWADNRYFDLGSLDLKTDVAALETEWEFYWDRFLLPGEIFPSERDYMAVPGRWDQSGLYDSKGIATYRIRVFLPKNPQSVALYMPFSYSRYRVFINDRLWTEHGNPDSAESKNGERKGPLVLPLPEQQVLDIIIHVANFDDSYGGLLEAPQIGSFTNLNKGRDRAKIFEAVLFGAFFITGMLYISFYINKKDDDSSLYFGLFSIVLALRTILYGEHIMLQILPDLSMELEAALGHMTFYLAVPLFLKFITMSYPMKYLKKINIPVFIISSAFILFAFIAPYRVYIEFLFLFQIIALLTGLFIVICLIRIAFKGNPSAGITLMGFLIMLAASVNDILDSQEIIHTFHMVPLGVTAFIMSQASLLSWNIGRAFTRSEELAKELTTANNSFRRFVPEEFLKYLKKDTIADIRLGDHVEMEMTVLFCDIRDFTSMSENMTPHENFLFLNSFLERIGPVIRKNGGFVDKYIGDGVMALFSGKPDYAVIAALQIEKALDLYNQHRVSSGYEAIRIGIGINTGSLMLGTIGENERMDSTVISDAVNVCSRIESITKEYGLGIAISEYTYSRLEIKNKLQTRNIGRVILKGKKDPVSVFELYNSDPPQVIKKKNKFKKHFEEAVELFEKKEFEKSLSIFTKLMEVFPEDETCGLYQKKIFQSLTNLIE